MKPEDIKALRKELRCTPGELAEALGVTPSLVMDWEQDAAFPTKRFVSAMQELRAKGPTAIVRRRGRQKSSGSQPFEVLADPELWTLIRKLIAHPELREQVKALAAGFDDPKS